MSHTSTRRDRFFTHLHMPLLLCCGSLTEPNTKPSKPISQLEQIPQPSNASKSPLVVPLPKGSACSFFERLPIELRLRVYEYALGGQTIHLVHTRNQDTELPSQYSSVVVPSMIGANWDPLEADPFQSPVINTAFLLACRQVYREAVDILYSTNNFVTDDIRTFIHFGKDCLGPQRLLTLKHLHVIVTWRVRPLLASYTGHTDVKEGFYDFAIWKRFWHIVANDMKLTSLKIQLQFSGQDFALDDEWVKPLLEIRNIKRPDVMYGPFVRILPGSQGQLENFRQGLITSISRKRDGF